MSFLARIGGFTALVFLSTYSPVVGADSVDALVAKLTQPLTKEGTLGKEAKEVVDGFGKTTVSEQRRVYAVLTKMLGAPEPRPKGAPPVPDAEVVGAALIAVAPLARTPVLRREAAEALEPLLQSPKQSVRFQAAHALGRFGDPASFKALLGAAARDRDAHVRRAARTSLPDALRDDPAWPFAEQLVGYGDEVIYEWLADAKGDTFAERVEVVVPSLAQEMENKSASWEHRWRAARLLGRTHSDAAEKALVDRLLRVEEPHDPAEKPTGPSFNLRVQAASSLMTMGRRTRLRDPDVQKNLMHQIVTEAQDVSETTRHSLAHALGFSQSREALPFLAKVMSGGKDEEDKFLRIGAALGLREMAKNIAFAEPLGRAMLPLVKSKDPWLQMASLEILENIGDRIKSSTLRDQIDDEVAKVLGTPKDPDACKLLCDMMAAKDKWDFEAKKPGDVRYNTGSFHPSESFPLAVIALESLSVLEARRFCEKETKERVDAIRTHWEDKKGVLERAYAKHRAHAFRKDGLPYNSNAIYAEAFAVHLYRTLEAADTDRKVKEKHETSRKAAEAQLAKTLGKVAEAGEAHPFPSSVFQTHAFATSLLAAAEVPAEASALATKLAERTKHGATVSYYPTDTEAGTKRGSAPRSVGFFLSRFRAWRDKTTTVDPRPKLLEALEAYGAKARLYAAHATREGTHGGLSSDAPLDGIAPYYFWANLAFVSTALRAMESADLDAGQKATLAWVKKRHLEAIATLKGDDNAFKSPGPGTYPAGKTWGNAYAALALVPLVDSCDGKPVTPVLGPFLTATKSGASAAPHVRPAASEKAGKKAHGASDSSM